MGHHESCLIWWGCLEVLGYCWILQLLLRRLREEGGGHQIFHSLPSSKICLSRRSGKPNQNCRTVFHSSFACTCLTCPANWPSWVCANGALVGGEHCGGVELRKVSNAWDICNCSECQAVLGGTVTSSYVIKAYHCHRQWLENAFCKAELWAIKLAFWYRHSALS